MGASTANGPGRVKPEGFPHELPHQFVAAERVARKYGFSRREADEIGLASQHRAAAAQDAGRFAAEITPVNVRGLADVVTVSRDEGLRPTTAEGLAKLTPLREDGIHTAGNTSQVSDGAAAVLWMDRERARELGLRPQARLLGQVLVGADPYYHIEGPLAATRAVLAKAGMTVGDIDLFEINEAFASVVLAWLREFQPDPAKLNSNGGAIALGHPLGATGARLITTALHELDRRQRGTALIAMCCGSAVGVSCILERI